MEVWFIVLIIAEIALFLLYIYFLRKYPILFMPFDYQYRVFKRVYRAYKPVREGKKLYSVFADDFLFAYKHSLERKASREEYIVANRVCNIIENHREKVERYFSGKFSYSDYLNLKSEYDLFQEQVIEAQNEETTSDSHAKFKYSVTLRQKVLLFESLFRVCRVDASNSDKARFIRNLLEVEPNTKKIGDTNTYGYLEENSHELLSKGKIISRIKDYEYVAQQLEYLKLERERTIILNEINELRKSIDE